MTNPTEGAKLAIDDYQYKMVTGLPTELFGFSIRAVERGQPVGLYLNPGNDSFRIAVNGNIYVDKTGMISFLNQEIASEFMNALDEPEWKGVIEKCYRDNHE